MPAVKRRVRDREGASFSLGRFHDRLLSYGSIPIAVIQDLMLAPLAASAAIDATPASCRRAACTREMPAT